MKGLVSGGLFTITLCVLAMYSSPSEAGVAYTSVHPKKCWKPPKQILVAYDEQGLDVLECNAPAGWRVYTVVAGDRSWVDFQHGRNTWTTEDEVAYDQATRFGNFPNVGEGVMEWGVTSSGRPSYAIFRVNAQDAGDEASVGDVVSRLFVIDLNHDSPTFCGTAKTNEEARALATAARCNKPVRKRTGRQGDGRKGDADEIMHVSGTGLNEQDSKTLQELRSVPVIVRDVTLLDPADHNMLQQSGNVYSR